MNWSIHLFFIAILAILGFLFYVLVLDDILKISEFETITKFEGYYDDPIFVIFHWSTEDELQVGKPILIKNTVVGLPYTKTPEKNITIHYLDTHFRSFEKHELKEGLEGILLFFERKLVDKPLASPEEIISSKNYVTLDYSTMKNVTLDSGRETNSVVSDSTLIRYITPINVSANLCDSNINSTCQTIEGIIHPAPYYILQQVESNRIMMTVAIIAIFITIIFTWREILLRNQS